MTIVEPFYAGKITHLESVMVNFIHGTGLRKNNLNI